MRTEEIEGLRSLPESDLTVEEKERLEIAEEQIEEEKKGYITDIEMLASVFAEKENGPKIYDIQSWKDQYKVLHVSSIFQEDDLYIWRTLNRSEYKQLLKSGMLGEQARAEDTIVRRCLLYPEPTESFLLTSPAGIVSTLKEQIMHRSGFVPEGYALSQIKVL